MQAPVPAGSTAPASVEPLAVNAGTLPPCARLVAAPARGGALLVDVAGSSVTLRRADDAAVGPASHAPLGAPGLRIEAAVALGGGATVALLLSGLTEVVALAVDSSLAITSAAALPLPGHAAPSTQDLSHNLAAQGPARLAAATDAGVFVIEVSADTSGVHLALDPTFHGGALRGPVDAVWSEPH